MTGVQTCALPISALNDGLRQVWHINCSDGTNTVTSNNRSIGIDASAPALTIDLPTGEYFTQGLPYLNLPINFSYTEDNPDSCWYNVSKYPTELGCDGSNCNLAWDRDWSSYGGNASQFSVNFS